MTCVPFTYAFDCSRNFPDPLHFADNLFCSLSDEYNSRHVLQKIFVTSPYSFVSHPTQLTQFSASPFLRSKANRFLYLKKTTHNYKSYRFIASARKHAAFHKMCHSQFACSPKRVKCMLRTEDMTSQSLRLSHPNKKRYFNTGGGAEKNELHIKI